MILKNYYKITSDSLFYDIKKDSIPELYFLGVKKGIENTPVQFKNKKIIKEACNFILSEPEIKNSLKDWIFNKNGLNFSYRLDEVVDARIENYISSKNINNTPRTPSYIEPTYGRLTILFSRKIKYGKVIFDNEKYFLFEDKEKLLLNLKFKKAYDIVIYEENTNVCMFNSFVLKEYDFNVKNCVLP